MAAAVAAVAAAVLLTVSSAVLLTVTAMLFGMTTAQFLAETAALLAVTTVPLGMTTSVLLAVAATQLLAMAATQLLAVTAVFLGMATVLLTVSSSKLLAMTPKLLTMTAKLLSVASMRLLVVTARRMTSGRVTAMMLLLNFSCRLGGDLRLCLCLNQAGLSLWSCGSKWGDGLGRMHTSNVLEVQPQDGIHLTGYIEHSAAERQCFLSLSLYLRCDGTIGVHYTAQAKQEGHSDDDNASEHIFTTCLHACVVGGTWLPP